MPTVSRHVTIAAPREAVWATLADIGSVSRWNPVVTHSVETSDDASSGGVGASRHCELPGSMGAIDEVVTGWNDLESMSFEISGAKMMRSMRARFDLAEDGDRTRVTMTSDFAMTLGPIGSLMAATLGRRMLGRNMEQTLSGLKQHVEAGPGRPAAPASAETREHR